MWLFFPSLFCRKKTSIKYVKGMNRHLSARWISHHQMGYIWGMYMHPICSVNGWQSFLSSVRQRKCLGKGPHGNCLIYYGKGSQGYSYHCVSMWPLSVHIAHPRPAQHRHDMDTRTATARKQVTRPTSGSHYTRVIILSDSGLLNI